MRNLFTNSVRLAGALALAACANDATSLMSPSSADNYAAAGRTVVVTLAPSSVAVGGKSQGTSVVKDVNGTTIVGMPVYWSSSDTTVAVVSSTGLITGKAAGSAVIKAENGVNLRTPGTATLTVTAPVTPIASVGVTLASGSLGLAQTTQATAVAKDSAGNVLTGRTMIWSSGDTTIAKVSQSGLVTAVAAGATTIAATSGGKTGSAQVSVASATPVAKTITMSAATASLNAGATTQLSATVLDQNGKPMTVVLTWSSSNTAVATVSQAGLVTGTGAGTATITAATGALKATSTVTVSNVTTPPPGPVGSEVLATLPLAYVNTSMPAAPAAGGKVIPVAAGGNLQTAINSAMPGDVIELANGATFTGNFTLPNKNTTSTNWITIRPANWASLPAAGTRMTPTLAGQLNLPKVLSGNSNNTIVTALSAHHYRIMGIEIGILPSVPQNWGLVAFDGGAGQTSLGVVPHDLILDRTYIHGTSTAVLRRCILLNSANSAVIDSWISDCHDDGADSQAILGYNGPGPFKITNNYLEGAGENVMFGGADPAIPNLVPGDIEIRGNHFFKPLSWKMVWVVKNLFETKNAQRVLLEGNLLENSWTHGQNGLAIGIKTSNQSGGCTWCVSQDITVRNNFIRNVGAVFNIAGSPDNNFQDIHARRITVVNNIATNINVGAFNGDGRGFAVFGDPADVTIAHNTLMSPTSSGVTFGPYGYKIVRLSLRDNVVNGGAYGVIGDNFVGGSALNYYAPGGTFLGNVVILVNGASGYPTGNNYPSNASAVGFLNAGAFDFHLTASSPYKNKATDGRDPGADVDVINAALVGVP